MQKHILISDLRVFVFALFSIAILADEEMESVLVFATFTQVKKLHKNYVINVGKQNLTKFRKETLMDFYEITTVVIFSCHSCVSF